MGSKSLIVTGVLIVLLVGGFYFYFNSQPAPNSGGRDEYSEITYDDCVEGELSDLRKLPPASEEPIGAKRTDEQGRVWIKSDEINQWDFDGNPILGAYAWKSDESLGLLLSNDAVDEFPDGSNYALEEFPECEKYIFTRNAKMEEEFNEIMREVINEQFQKGVIFSVENIEVINLAGRLQGSIDISCDKLGFETDESIVQSIAKKLFLRYPDEFGEGSERDSWVNVESCSETGGSPEGVNTYYRPTLWKIRNGYYDFAV
jgi:hypothetical protein